MERASSIKIVADQLLDVLRDQLERRNAQRPCVVLVVQAHEPDALVTNGKLADVLLHAEAVR